MPPDPDMIPTSTAASLLNCSEPKVVELALKNRLPARVDSTGLLVSRKDVLVLAHLREGNPTGFRFRGPNRGRRLNRRRRP